MVELTFLDPDKLTVDSVEPFKAAVLGSLPCSVSPINTPRSDSEHDSPLQPRMKL